jgi:carbon monoxide dehydrogenase subunit G
VKIEGTFKVAAPRSEVWRQITHPGLMASCIPGCESIETLSPTRYGARMAVGIGPIKATFNLVVEVTKEEPPERVYCTTRGEEGSRASMVSAESMVALTALDAATTQVDYSSEVSMSGRLGKFGLGVMKKKAAAMGDEFVAAFRSRIEGGVGAAAP